MPLTQEEIDKLLNRPSENLDEAIARDLVLAYSRFEDAKKELAFYRFRYLEMIYKTVYEDDWSQTDIAFVLEIPRQRVHQLLRDYQIAKLKNETETS